MRPKNKQISPVPHLNQGNKRKKPSLTIIEVTPEDALRALSTRPDYTIYEVRE